MAEKRQRTIVLFMVDQLAAKWLEKARQGVVDLPNFDALEQEGVTFTQAFTTNPVCSPSRATIATGLSSSVHGVAECGYDLDPSIPTFMHGLQNSGWTTAAAGKVHFIPQISAVEADYRPYGFDIVESTEDSRVGRWIDWVREAHPEHYQAVLSTIWMTMMPGLDKYGECETDLKAEILAAQTVYPESTSQAYELPFPATISQSSWITDRACEIIGDAEGDLFLHVSYVQPHNPFSPPSEYVERVNVDNIPAPVAADWREQPIPYYDSPRYEVPSYESTDWRRERQLYFADLAHLDNELGRIRTALSDSGRSDDLLFIFTSDHGELLHDHGLLGKFERHYDACIRVPLVVSSGTNGGRRRDQLVEHTDIAPTIYHWADVPAPTLPARAPSVTDTVKSLPGRSLLDDAADTGQEPRRGVYIQSNGSYASTEPRGWSRTLRDARYRYTRHLDGGGEQLFDLEQDPDEQRNLVLVPEFSDLLMTMRDRLTEAMAVDTYPVTPIRLYQVGAW